MIYELVMNIYFVLFVLEWFFIFIVVGMILIIIIIIIGCGFLWLIMFVI